MPHYTSVGGGITHGIAIHLLPLARLWSAHEGHGHRRHGHPPCLPGPIRHRRRDRHVLSAMARHDGARAAGATVSRRLFQGPGSHQLCRRRDHRRGHVVRQHPGQPAHHRPHGRRIPLAVGHRMDVLLPGNRVGILLLSVWQEAQRRDSIQASASLRVRRVDEPFLDQRHFGVAAYARAMVGASGGAARRGR